MNNQLGRTITVIVYFVVGLVLVAAVGGKITGKPTFLTVVRSYSMYPLYTRGDIVFVSPAESPKRIVKTGDIVVFRAESGSLKSKGWIIHRIFGGDPETGYITKGDNNNDTDQADGGTPPIKREWIASRAITLGPIPLKIPLLGYLPLWAEELQKKPYFLPVAAAVLAAVVIAGELAGRSKKREKRNRNLEQQFLYVFSGLTLAVMIAASMLIASQNFSTEYEVSSEGEGVMIGSAIGVMQQGETIEKPLSELTNGNIFPVFFAVTTSDPQVSFSKDFFILYPGEGEKVNFKVTAREVGNHKASLWVGMFYPLLPPAVIHYLALKSFWLALFATALVPALPLILFPAFDPRLRLLTKNEIRRKFRRMGRFFSLPH